MRRRRGVRQRDHGDRQSDNPARKLHGGSAWADPPAKTSRELLNFARPLDGKATLCDEQRMIADTTICSAFDGFELPALTASPEAEAKGGVVIIQEIFGLTPHVREMAGAFAAAGYQAMAPAMYARIDPNFHAAVDGEGIAKGRAAAAATPWPQAIADIQAAIDALPKPRFVAGFCWGGAAAWAAAAHCRGVRAASAFYGRLIIDMLDQPPRAPIMLHYGARDASIPHAEIERVRASARPDTPIYLYDAAHGFCRKDSPDFHPASCELAITRTLDWFARWRAAGEDA